jgi:hypothetical protein
MKLLGALAAVLLAASAAGAAATPKIEFRVYADTGIRLTDVVATSSRFLYVENTTNTVYSAPLSGAPLTVFAQMPKEVEETRCRLSPGTHGFAAGDIYCHAPDNTIYRISADGSSVQAFAHLPDTSVSDGALAFDTVGKLGYALIAAGGRSGGATPVGGTVYAIGANGAVRTIGTYAVPGGADELAIAPSSFGTGSGQVVLSVDAGSSGALVLMDAQGRTRTIATLPDGPNPIVVVQAPPRHRRTTPPPGLYVTDTASHDVFFAPASQLRPYAGDLIVGSEVKGIFWAVQPRGHGFRTVRLPATLPGTHFNLEGAVYVAG